MERTYLGPDNVRRSPAAHRAYLERCATRWDEEARNATTKQAAAAAHAQAAHVRAMAVALAKEES